MKLAAVSNWILLHLGAIHPGNPVSVYLQGAPNGHRRVSSGRAVWRRTMVGTRSPRPKQIDRVALNRVRNPLDRSWKGGIAIRAWVGVLRPGGDAICFGISNTTKRPDLLLCSRPPDTRQCLGQPSAISRPARCSFATIARYFPTLNPKLPTDRNRVISPAGRIDIDLC
jgi:hypothetical protein